MTDPASDTETVSSDDETTTSSVSGSASSSSQSLYDLDPEKFGKPVYKYYAQSNDPTRPRCKDCGDTIFKGSGGTTNLKRHLRRRHKRLNKILVAEEELTNKKIDAHKRITEYTVHRDIERQSPAPAAKCSSLAVPIGTFGSQLYYKPDDPRQLFIRSGLVNFIAMDSQPVAIVEDPGFLAFCNKMDPRFVVPCRDTVMRDCQQLYESTRQRVINELNESCQPFCFTTDIWTSRVGDAYGSITVHFIDKQWELASRRLGPMPFPGDHDAAAVAGWLQERLDAWGLGLNNAVAATTDNGSNIVKALDTVLKQTRLPCFGHVLNLICQKFLSVKSVADTISKCRALVEKFHRKRAARESLQAAQSNQKTKYAVIGDCVTRWNSTFFMVSRIIYLMDYIVDVTAKHPELQRHLPSDAQWKMLQDVMVLLQPLADMTTYFSSSSYVTGSAVAPIVSQLRRHLTPSSDPLSPDSCAVTLGKGLMLDLLDKYYSRPQNLELLNKMAFLDPRFKSFAHAPGEKQSTERSIQTELCKVIENSRRREQRVTGPKSIFKGQSHRGSGLSSLHGGIYSEGDSVPSVQGSCEEVALRELQRYMALPEPRVDESPLAWWKYHGVELLYLKQLSQKYLCIVATSVPSECMFSIAGDIVTASRNRLLPENVHMFGFLHDNIPKQGFFLRRIVRIYAQFCKITQ